MQKKIKKLFAYVLTLCMILGLAQIPAVSGHAAAADGQIDTSEEGWEIVRYYTNTETSVTSAQEKSERLTDFLLGTESMVWSVDFKTSQSKLQSLLMLDSNDKYYSLYVKTGKVAFEQKGVQTVSQTSNTNYADGQWHTALLEMTRNGKTKVSVDGTVVAEANTGANTCITDLAWTPTAFTIGGATAYSSASGWTFSGSMRNVVLKKKLATPLPDVIFSAVNPGEGSVSTEAGELESGSVNLTYRLKTAGDERVTLLGFGDSGEIYADAAANKVGIQAGSASVEASVENTKLNTEKWHTLTAAWGGGQASIYVDGVLAGTGTFNGAVNAGTLDYSADVYCSEAALYSVKLDEEHVLDLHAATASSTYPDGTEKLEGYNKTENREIFNSGFDGSVAYRIPGIVTSRKTGTVIAAIDKRWNHSGDVGKIDSVVRRSEDNGKTWGPVIPVIDMPDDDAYTVDPALAVDNNEDSPYYGRIYMLVDMFPYNIGLFAAQPGTGYTEIDGVQCRKLFDADGNVYTVRENGIVYDSEGNVTEYQVETEAEAPYKEQGALYKNGKKIGSIFKNSELKIYETTYLWVSYSDDDGLTWSIPKDITPMIKDDWMRFSGTGPGRGIQLQNGRIMFSAYSSHRGAENALSSFNVYTDDGGETWHRGASPNDISDTENASNSTRELNENQIVQLDNGHLIQFMKNATNNVAMAISTDNGESWGEVTYAAGITEPHCNLSALHYPGKILDPEDGEEKEAIIFANPRGTRNFTSNGREGGTVRIAFVNEDDTLDWAYSKLIEENSFIYCSLTAMNNGDIGIIYEHEGYATVGAAFTSFSPEYIMDSNTYENTPAPTGITSRILDENGQTATTLTAGSKVEMDVTFSQKVFAAGNVTLNVKVGNEEKEAALVGNVSDNVLRFAYTIAAEDSGKVTATGEVNVKEGGTAETIYNVSLTDKPIVTKDIYVGTIESAFAVLPTTGMTATAGSAYNGTTEGPASLVLDGNLNTHWHSDYANGGVDNVSNGGRPKHWVTIALGGSRLVSGLEYTPRANQLNGCVTEYQIEVSTNGTDFVPVATGTWLKNANVKTADFGGAVLATHVKFRVLETGDEWASAAEIRIIGTEDTAVSEDKTELLNLIMELGSYGDNEELKQALASAEQVAQSTAASAQDVSDEVTALANIKSSLAKTAKENLESAIAEGEIKNKDNYSLSVWIAYTEALNAAKEITADSEEQDVIAAYENLMAAERRLAASAQNRLNTAKKAASAVLKEAEENIAAGQGSYSDATWNLYSEAYNNLAEALESENMDSVTLKSLTAALESAAESLEEASEDELARREANAALENAKQVIDQGQGNYTDATWNAYNEAYNNLKAALESEDTDVATLRSLASALESAGEALALLTEDEIARKDANAALQTAKAVIDKGQGNYTDESWNAYKAAYDALDKALKENKDAASLQALIAALKGIKLEEKAAPGPNPQPTPVLEQGGVYQVNTLKYKVTNLAKKTVEVTGTTNRNIKTVKVPKTVTILGVKCKVTSIGAKAFQNCKKLTKVTIGANVTSIGKQAFAGCKKLKNITIKGKNLKKVKAKAFKGISKKAVIKVPKAKKAKYKKLLSKKGQAKTVKIK